MGKAKIYGLKTKCNPRLQLDLRYQRKQRQRQRESVTRKPVAAQIVKEKKAQEKMAPLKIAFLAWNAEQTDMYLRTLAIDNCEQVKRYDRPRGRVELKDGTVIRGVHPQSILEGLYFDQVIVADDRRLQLLRYRGAVLNELDHRCMFSKVPEEYRYQFYDLDEEAPKNGT